MKSCHNHRHSSSTSKDYRKEGFTLIEFLIYSVIVTLLVGTLVLIGSNIMQGRARVGVIEEVSHGGRRSMERITYDIRQAESIISPTIGSEGAVLSLEVPIKENNPTDFYVNENGVLVMKTGTGLLEKTTLLTADNIFIDNLKFTNVSYVDAPGAVRIEMLVKFNNPTNNKDYDFEKVFYTTENIRK